MGAIDGAPKEIRRLLIRCEEQGATVTLGRGGHFKVKGEGWTVIVSQTPRNVAGCIKAATRDLRRCGLKV